MLLRAAKVLALAGDHIKVLDDGANTQWNLPYAAIEPSAVGRCSAPVPAEVDSSPSRPATPSTPDHFHSGDKVVFQGRLMQPRFGTIARINRQTATGHTEDGKIWRFSFTLQRHIVD